jgi:hypothetical protein
MRADAHYVEQLDARTPTTTVQYVAVHAIDCSDGRPVEPSSVLVDSIKRHGVLEPLILQRSAGTYRTLAGAKRLAAARAAGLREVPCLVHHVADEQARALRDALTRNPSPAAASGHTPAVETTLAESLITLGSCAALMKSATPLTRSIATELVQAETRRATYLLQAAQALRQDAIRGSARIAAADLLGRIVDAVEPERRLRRIAFDADIDGVRGVELRGDPQLLLASLALVVLTTMTLLEGVDGPCLIISASEADRSRMLVTITQDHIALAQDVDSYAEAIAGEPHASASRASIPANVLAIAALRRVAQLHDGRLKIVRSGLGAQVVLELPISRS